MPGLYVPLEQACLRRSIHLLLLHLESGTAILSVCREPACHQAWEGGCCLGGKCSLRSGYGRFWALSRALEPECRFVCNVIKSSLLKSIHVAKIPGKGDVVDMLLGRNTPSSVGHDPSPGKAGSGSECRWASSDTRPCLRRQASYTGFRLGKDLLFLSPAVRLPVRASG